MDIEKNSKQKQLSKHQEKQGTKRTKQYKTQANDGFKKPKNILEETREVRINRNNQMRRNKLNDYMLKKRGIIDSDGNSSIDISRNKSMSLSNLTQLIDLTTYKIPPKVCVLIALNEDASLDKVLKNIENVITDSLIETEKRDYRYVLNENTVTYTIPSKIYKGKQRLTFIKTSRDVYSIWDACKIADIIIFVTSSIKAEYDKWQLDPDKHAHCIDDFGYKILSMIKCQGWTDHLCCIQDLGRIPLKHRGDIKKLYTRYFDSEVKPNKTFSFYNEPEESDFTWTDNDNNETKAIIRLTSAWTPYLTNWDIRKHRSYMMVEEIKENPDNKLHTDIFGYIRGNTWNNNNYIHITGFGDYKVLNVEQADDPLPVKQPFTNPKVNTKTQNENSMKIDTETKGKGDKKIKDDDIENKHDMINNTKNIPQQITDGSNKNKVNNNKNTSKDAEEILDEVIDFDIDIKDDDDISYKSDNNDNEDEEEKQRISNKHKMKTGLKYRTKEEMEFQDEVDTPIDIPAKERFKKYRGWQSMKSGSWNPWENLPKEYGNIFSFDNIKNTHRIAIKNAHLEGLKISGSYIKITVMNFDRNDLKYIRHDTPIVLSTLWEHERKLCVMNYKISTYYDQDDVLIQNMNKKNMECHCGFRRYWINPIFSVDIYNGSDKVKYEKYLDKDKFYICSAYAQLTYANSPTMLFTRKNNNLSLLATGIAGETDAKRIILKKVVLTGYPVKIKKKNAVVRYMFFNPTDVNYFKPIELTTKNGLRGHIRESIGTHGYMKCYFNDFMKSNDTVCLNLYKRVYPAWFKETWRYKIFNGNREFYMNYFKTKEEEMEIENDKDIK